jgi:hypothetical protein
VALECSNSTIKRSEKGTHVLLHGEPGVIELVADPDDNPGDWYVKEHGGGVTSLEPKVFGRLFVSDTANYEDLDFVSRSEA